MNKFLLAFTFFLILSIGLKAQGVNISGKVISASDGTELPGVNVSIKNTTMGTITDIDGNYNLAVPSGREILVFSFIGYLPQEVTVGNRSTINIRLETDVRQLEEVVVTGFQEVERKLFTGADKMLKMDDIRSVSMVDPSRMLEGQAAGVTVDNVSGTFGATPRIRIRGNTSINGDNQPLWVIDGVILEDLTNVSADDIITGNPNTVLSSSIAGLNPNDIESFQILKDASATALYGTRAKNGVIVITTKGGKSGKLRVNYSGSFSANLRPTYSQFDILNSYDEMSIFREMHEKGLVDLPSSVRAQNFGALGKMFSLINEKELAWGPNGSLNEEFLHQYAVANTDWFDVLFRDMSLQQQHSVSLTSGTEKFNSYYSFSFLNDNGQTIADNVKRYSGTAKNRYMVNDRLNLDLKLTANYREQTLPGTQNRDFDPITGRYRRDFDINPLSYALNTSRSIRPYDNDGNYEYFRRNFAPFNILRELELNYIDVVVADIALQTDINYRIADNLHFRSTVQGRYASTRREHVIHEHSNQAEAYRADGTQYFQDANPLLFRNPDDPTSFPQVVLPEGGFNNVNQDALKNFYIRNSVEWSKNFGTLHNINVLAGQEIKYTDRTSQRADGIGVVYESGSIVNTDPKMVDFLRRQGISLYALDIDKERFAGFFLNGGYAFNSKYIVNGTIRYDGSNRLGKSKDSRYLPTWNISGAWNLDQENFIKAFNFVNVLKLRGTYGLSADLGPSTSALLNLQSAVTLRPTDTESYLFIRDLENRDLTWEKLYELNIGLDFALLNNKITGTVDYYTRDAFDLIGLMETSGVGGVAYKFGNYADMKADGFEAAINTVVYTRNRFSWQTNFNIGYTRDRITRLDFGPRLADAISQGGAAVLGGPRRSIFSTKFAGLDNRGIPTFLNEDGERVYNYNLQDRDNLTDILQYEGPAEPRGAGGFGNIFSYGNLSLNILLSFKFDYKIRLDDAFNPIYTDFSSLSQSFRNRWMVPGDENITDIPVILDRNITVGTQPDFLYAYDLYNKSTVRVADGGYVRLRTIRLSYNMPDRITRFANANSVQLSVEGQNLWLLYADPILNGQDPEFFSTGGVALPQPRMITAALMIAF